MTQAPDHVHASARLRGLFMVVPPLALAVALLWHPAGGPNVYEDVRDDVGAWLFVHVSFLLLTPLLGCGVLLLLHGLHDRAASVSRAALVFFLVFYTAYEVSVGVSTGVLVSYGKDLPATEQAVLADAVQDYSTNPITADPSISLALGSLGWVVAMIAAAVALRRAGASRTVTLLLGVAALFVVHPPPVGPVALVCFAAACVLVERSRSRAAPPAAVPRMRSAAASGTESPAAR